MVNFLISGWNRKNSDIATGNLIGRWFANQVFAVLFLMSVSSLGLAQSTQSEIGAASRFVLLQGQDFELPEDFLVKVDGDKLQVALVSLGIHEKRTSTASMLVRLFDSNGEEKVAKTNNRGVAEFDGVKAGELHALLVADENVHAALPVMTVSAQLAKDNAITADQFRLPLMPANPKEILASINRDIPPSKGPAGELYVSSDYSPQSVTPYAVRLQSNGNLAGQVVVADRELAEKLRYAKLTFMRNNQVVGKTDSNPRDGSFSIDGLSEGVYGVIAAGPAGYSSFAFDVLPAIVKPELPVEGVFGKPVSFVQDDPNRKLYVFLCPPKLVPNITKRIRDSYGPQRDDGAIAAFPGGSGGGFGGGGGAGGFGGGGFGGGGGGLGGGGGGIFGGGGGIGGFGPLIGLAGVGAIAAVIANDNNDVVSPVTR